MSRTSSIRAFNAAVELLRTLDPSLSLYVAGNTLCLMHGPSHDKQGRPLQKNIIAHDGGLRIGGGDW